MQTKMASNGRTVHMRGGRAPQFLVIGVFIVICVLAFNVSSRNKILQKQVEEMKSTLQELAMKKIHLEKRSDALQMQVTDSNRITVVLRHEKDTCVLELQRERTEMQTLTDAFNECEKQREDLQSNLDIEMSDTKIKTQQLEDFKEKLKKLKEDDDAIDANRQGENQEHQNEILEFAENLKQCEDQKEYIVSSTSELKLQVQRFQTELQQCQDNSLRCKQLLQQQQHQQQQQPGVNQQEQRSQHPQQQEQQPQGMANQQTLINQQQSLRQQQQLQQEQQQPVVFKQEVNQPLQGNEARQQFVEQQEQEMLRRQQLEQQLLEQQQQRLAQQQQQDNERGVPLEVGEAKSGEKAREDPGPPNMEENEDQQLRRREGETKEIVEGRPGQDTAREDGVEDNRGPAYQDGQDDDEEERRKQEEQYPRRAELEERLKEQLKAAHDAGEGNQEGERGDGAGEDERPKGQDDDGGEREDVEDGDQERGPEYNEEELERDQPGEAADRETIQDGEGGNIPVVDEDLEIEGENNEDNNGANDGADYAGHDNDNEKNAEDNKDDIEHHYDADDPQEGNEVGDHDEAKEVYGQEDGAGDKQRA